MSLDPSLKSASTLTRHRNVLTRPPAGFVRYGTALVVLSVGLLIGAAAIISYPDTLAGPVVLTTNPQPQRIIVRVNGRLGRLLSLNDQLVGKGQPLAEIENTTQLANVPRLRQLTADVRRFLQRPAANSPSVSEKITFGDIQTDVNTLIKECANYHRLVSDAYLSERLNLLSQEISQYRQLAGVNGRQSVINGAELTNAEQKYRVDQRLFSEKIYSRVEFLGMENDYLRKKRGQEEFEKTLIQNQLQVSTKEKEQLDLRQQHTQQLRTTSDNFGQYSTGSAKH